jgi:hypothetical protein
MVKGRHLVWRLVKKGKSKAKQKNHPNSRIERN